MTAMILADTSIWIDHLGHGDPLMTAMLDDERIVMHAYVLGEVTMGNLRYRARVISDLLDIPQLPVVAPDELIAFVTRHKLFGRGVGYVDAHLLASALITPGTRLWTRDKRLHEAAEQLRVAARPVN